MFRTGNSQSSENAAGAVKTNDPEWEQQGVHREEIFGR